MRITGLRADGFGVFRGLEIDGLSEGLHVFYGPNEAGKTTLMQFVRSVLYGFSPERKRYLPPVHGGRPGGELRLVTSEGRLAVSRYENVEEPGRGDHVHVVYPDGTRQTEHVLKTILGGIDENLFNHVFCVGLRDLQELGTLGDTDAARMLYDLSTGLGAISMSEVVKTLADARNRILDADGRPCEVGRLLQRRHQLRAELEESGRVSRDYGRLAAEQTRVQRDLGRLEEETKRLRHDLRVTEIAASVRGRWQERIEADRQLAAVGPLDSIPEGAIGRLESIESRLAHRRNLLKKWKARWSSLRREARGLKPNETLERLGPRIEALREQQPWLKTLEDRTAELESQINELEARFAVERRQLGIRDDGSATVPSLSGTTMQVLRHPARAMKQARIELEQAERALAETEEQALTLSEQVETSLAGWGVDDLSLALQRQGDAVARLRRRVQIDQRLDQMHEHQKELEGQGHRLIENQAMPVWAIVALGGFLIAVTSLLLFLGLTTNAGFGFWGWPLGLFLVIGAVGAVSTKAVWERANASRLKACRRQSAMLASQIEEAHREREKLDRELPRSDDSIQEQLRDAERQMAELEAFVGRDAQRLSAQEAAESAARRLDHAKQAMAEAKNRWRRALSTAGLPEDLAPKQIRSLLARSEELADVRRRLDHRYEELQQRNRELDALRQRVADVVVEAGLSAPPADPAQGLQVLSQALLDQQAKQKRLGELRIKARRMRRKRKKIERSARRLKGHRRRLFRTVGTADEAEFRRRATHFAEFESLRAHRAGLHREIEAAIAGYCAEEMIAEALEGQTGDSLRERGEEFRKELASVERRLQESCEHRGKLNEQLRLLSDDRAPGAKQLKMNVVEQQLADALHRWRVRALAGHTLAEIRHNYQRDRQPETLQEASDYLERLTQGRYTRVWTPLDEDVLLVDDGQGEPRSIDVLSQGTREQLFICLRLALAAGFARRGAALPIVLDDVLVNFDVERAKAAAAVMRDFAAAGHQVLVFTCHEHIQKLFKSLKVPVDTLPRNSETARLAVAAPSPKPAKPAAKPVQQPAAEAEPMPDPRPVVVEPPAAEEQEEEALTIEEPEIVEIGEEEEVVSFEARETQPEEDDLWEDEEGDDEPFDEDEYEWEELVDEEDVAEPAFDVEDDEVEEPEEASEDEEEPAEDGGEYGYEEDDEFEVEEEESLDEDDDGAEYEDDSPDSRGSQRRFKDDWDDRYEDEYDELEEAIGDPDAEDGEDDEYEYYEEEYERTDDEFEEDDGAEAA